MNPLFEYWFLSIVMMNASPVDSRSSSVTGRDSDKPTSITKTATSTGSQPSTTSVTSSHTKSRSNDALLNAGSAAAVPALVYTWVKLL
ncbi:hypothetical protein DSO57_1015956 [Entomophthora muscae]|uniref:Uncharacterized protein n=1 Tax=Entomophthora muscae TaxID=34485 RepID=A0ACC2T4W8_9FUNG|nr:hypothetical protein DSO57_1015956 [Entomophthora muscae]